jgi:hypothetical protein
MFHMYEMNYAANVAVHLISWLAIAVYCSVNLFRFPISPQRSVIPFEICNGFIQYHR